MDGLFKTFDFRLGDKPHRINIIGSSESGKTNLCKNLIIRSLDKNTDIYILYSHNRITLQNWEKFFVEFGRSKALILVEESPQDEKLMRILKLCASKKKKQPRYTVILDDFVGSITSKQGLNLKKSLVSFLMTQSRHLDMNVILLSQDITVLPPRSYDNSTINIIMKTSSYYNIENHLYAKIFSHTFNHLEKKGLVRKYSKGEICKTIYKMISNLPPYSGVVCFRDRQSVRIYILRGVINYDDV